MKSSYKHFSFIAIGRIVTISLHAIFYLFFAAILGPEKFGELSVIIALAGTFSIISRLGLPVSIQVYEAKEKKDVSNQIKTLFFLSTSIAGIMLLFINPLASVLCIMISLFTMNLQNLLGLSEYKKFMLFSILKSVSFVLFPFILYFVLDIQGILIGMIISNFIASIPLFRKFKFVSFTGLRNYYKVLIQNFGVDVGSTLHIMIDKLVIAALFSFVVVGVYQFNLQIIVALGTLPGILASFLITEESKGISHGKISMLSVITSVIFSIATIALSPYFVNEFFPAYSDGIESLQILSLNIIPQTFGSIYASKLLAKESKKIGFSALVKIGSLITLIIFLGEPFGLIGLSLAFLFSNLANTIFLYALHKRTEKDSIRN